MVNENELITQAQAARLIKLKRQSIAQHIKRGNLITHTPAKLLRVVDVLNLKNKKPGPKGKNAAS
jgi:hypothetical protein